MILLSFDIEEFDLPQEHGVEISMEEQMRVSIEGTCKILDCLQRNKVKATFFCTGNFALHAPEVIKRIQAEGHEIASHGLNHGSFTITDLKESKDILELIAGTKVYGYRQARMMPVPEEAVREAGYIYNSSLNPTFIPGRYMNLSVPRTHFKKEGVMQFPASVTPYLRFPLFWLSYHHLPAAFYRYLCANTYRHDGCLVIYFHPWEFYPLSELPHYKVPYIVRRRSGEVMIERLEAFIRYFVEKGSPFGGFMDFIENLSHSCEVHD